MKRKTFANGSQHDYRRIIIMVTDEYVEFHYEENYNIDARWIQAEIERREESGEEPLTDEEKQIHGFYWFDSDHWKADVTQRLDRPDNWLHHMKRKNWFTDSMRLFIDESLGIKRESTPTHLN